MRGRTVAVAWHEDVKDRRRGARREAVHVAGVRVQGRHRAGLHAVRRGEARPRGAAGGWGARQPVIAL